MTSEVVIMNRRAIALAADSAVTVSSIQDGRRQSKYFKGANKVFELSHHRPVGIMIFDTADVHAVPWEIIIKSYREHLGRTSFSTLEDYAKNIFAFVENHTHLFPSSRQEELFKLECVTAAFRLLDWTEMQPLVADAPDALQKDEARQSLLDNVINELSSETLSPHFSANAVADALARFREALEPSISALLQASKSRLDPKRLLAVVVEIIFKRYQRYLTHTGIVIAGYGDDDYFPGFVQYDCYGILLGTFIADKSNERHVTVENGFPVESGSHIQPFAMNDMVHTFMSGISPDIFRVVRDGFKDALEALAKCVQNELRVASIPDLAKHTDDCLSGFLNRLIDAQVSEHYQPLTRVVGSLPIDEMANLAETLIMLESLKEKVTRPSESVGGPIDVAVITKAEGLVWIKRKHYFPAELNSRFLERQRQRLT